MAKNLVATSIRFPRERLLVYRQVALEMGKSLSGFINEVVGESVREIMLVGKISKRKPKKKMTWVSAPIWNYKKYAKWASGVKDGARNHDKYIYGDPHRKGKYEWK